MDLAKKEGEQLSQGSYEEDIQKMDNEKTIEYRQFLSSFKSISRERRALIQDSKFLKITPTAQKYFPRFNVVSNHTPNVVMKTPNKIMLKQQMKKK